MTTFLICGSTGMLGSACLKYLRLKHTCVELNRQQFNVETDTILKLKEAIISITTNIKNVFIINAIGIIKQRPNYSLKCMIQANSIFPHWLEMISNELKLNLIHISTDCVFDGISNSFQGYKESDLSSEHNDVYSVTKQMGEKLLSGSVNSKIIRTSIIGHETKNGLSLLNWVLSQKGKTCSGYDNHFWNGVTCLQLAKIIEEIAINNNQWCGIRHIFSPQSVSKYQLLQLINQEYDLNITVKKQDHEKSCDKRLCTEFKDTQDIFKIIPCLKDQIHQMRVFELKTKPIIPEPSGFLK